jgi:Flp pilus assembly protein TadD
VNLASALIEKGNSVEALREVSRAITMRPRMAEAYNVRGLAFTRINRDREALVDFNKAIELNPLLALAYQGRGIAKVKLKDPAGALKDFRRAVELSPELREVAGPWITTAEQAMKSPAK